jgi:hypothetical protein
MITFCYLQYAVFFTPFLLQRGDLVLIVSYLQEALALFQEIGAKLEVTKTEELLRQVHAQLMAA